MPKTRQDAQTPPPGHDSPADAEAAPSEFLSGIDPLVTPGLWSCGHVAGSMCAECYRALAAQAHALAAENDALHELLREARLGLRAVGAFAGFPYADKINAALKGRKTK